MSDHLLKHGRFDHSFVVRMILDFFLLLLLVSIAELGLRFVIVVYDFYSVEEQATEAAAEQLASDVRRIMLNTGGPVAARTVYPLLRRGHAERGLSIAIEPSDVTVRSIEATFGFTPQGVPADFPDGTYLSAAVPIEAEKFCTSCHTEAVPGDILGTVTVRNYLATHIDHWWGEVRLTGLMGLVKIMLHTTILFFLLRIRMEPLLSLRAVVAGLARGGSDLSLRAPVKSSDEFGELAANLNHFLDRVDQIVVDLRAVLDKVATLNQRIEAIQEHMRRSLTGLQGHLRDVRAHARKAVRGEPLLSPEWRQTVSALRAAMKRIVADHPQGAEVGAALDAVVTHLDATGERIRDMPSSHMAVEEGLDTLAGEFHDFERLVGEMAVLEEKMNHIAESGRTLVDRLHAETEADGPESRGKATRGT